MTIIHNRYLIRYMELLSEILIKILENGKIEVRFPDFDLKPEVLIKDLCFNALNEIRKIVNSSSNDPECYDRIEKIIQILEHYEIFTNRHDF